jgi:PAS domain S-box-containing protein
MEDQDSKSITDKLRVRNLSLAEAEAMYGSLIETLPAVVYVAEPFPPYFTIYVSPNIESLAGPLGYTLKEWLAKPDIWVNILHPEDREWVLRQTEESLNQRKENDYEYRVIAKDGAIYWLHDKGKFVLDKLGNVLFWQGVLLDITPRKKAEEERENLIRKLQEALAEVKTLSGLLPICASCKMIRDDKGYWNQIETYIADHTEAKFSHSICSDCAEKLYPEIYPEMLKEQARNEASSSLEQERSSNEVIEEPSKDIEP